MDNADVCLCVCVYDENERYNNDEFMNKEIHVGCFSAFIECLCVCVC